VNHSDVSREKGRLAMVISHIIICLMMVCLTISFTQFLGRFLPLGSNVPLWGGVITVEAFLSYYVNREKSPFSSEWLVARGAEWVVLFVVIKLVTEIQHGTGTLLHNLPLWQQNFVSAFFTGEYMSVLFVLLTVWVLGTLFASDLFELGGDEYIRQKPQIDVKQITQVRATAALYGMRIDDDTLPSNRRETHNRLLSRTLTVGVLMVIIAGILRQDRVALWPGQPLTQASVKNVVLYFVLGLVLFSQTNLLALQTAWGYEHASIQSHLAPRWVVYSILFVLGLGVLAFILPTRYSLGFLDTLLYALNFIRIIVEFIIGLIMLPVLLLFRIFSLLLGGGSGQQSPTESQPVTPTETPATNLPVHLGLPWWDVLRSFLFWGGFLAILGFALYQYLQQNQALLTALRRLPVWQWMRQAWQWLCTQLNTAKKGMTMVMQTSLNKLCALRTHTDQVKEWRFINPYRLTPRQQVVFFYHALVQRGEKVGYPRHPSQTPYEYARFIEPVIAEETDALTELTEGFLDARYSLHEVTPKKVGQVKQAWTRIRGRLKFERKRSTR
jgi:hypothetical protein